MATVEAENTLTGPAQAPIGTAALADEGLMAARPVAVAFREAWKQTLEKVSMMRFLRYPDLEAEGLTPPTSRAIAKSLKLIEAMMSEGKWPAPMRVLPSGEGGIVFERWDAERKVQRIEIFENGKAELCEITPAGRIDRGQIF